MALTIFSTPAYCDGDQLPPQSAGQGQAEVRTTTDNSPPASQAWASEQWKSHLWDAYPHDKQVGPPRPEPIMTGYRHRDWKPFFINSQFELNKAGELLIGHIESLRDQAIDPASFKIEELRAAVEKMKACRAALAAEKPGVSQTASASIPAENSTYPAPSRQRDGASGENAPAASGAQSRPLTPGQVRLHDDLFKAAAEADMALAFAFSRYAREMNPLSAGEEVRGFYDGQTSMADVLKEIEPSSPDYLALVKSFVRYRDLAANVNQQRISGSASIRHGESGNQVRDLQKRLQQEGFYSGDITGHFDHETQRAVKDFQSAHLVEPDGVLGRGTRDWLDVSFGTKAEMIAQALQSIRRSPARKYDRYIRINIPQFLLEYHKEGKVAEIHRVVVGSSKGKKVKFRGRMVGENQTPTLTSNIEQVILNPRWYVSDRIRLELNSEAKSDPEWFVKHGYVQMSSAYPWGERRIFQAPGPKNALGRVKFEFPNIYAVYLHDTPKKHLFARARRDFSHGCIRVDKALGLAETLLTDDKNPFAQKIDAVLRGTNQTFVKLSNPVPIVIEYVPVSSNGDGQLIFLGDPYGILKEEGNRKT